MHTGRTPCEGESRDWSEAPRSQELEGPPVNQWKLRERRGTKSPLQPAEDANPDDTQMSSLQHCCVSHPVLDVILCYDSPSNYRKSVKLLDPFSNNLNTQNKVYRITKEIKHMKMLNFFQKHLSQVVINALHTNALSNNIQWRVKKKKKNPR